MFGIGLGLTDITVLGPATGSAPPAAPTLTWTSGADEYDPTFTLEPIEQGDEGTLSIYTDAGLTSLFDSAAFGPVGEVEAEDGLIELAALDTLDFDTQYWAQGEVNGVLSNVETKTMDAEPLVPTVWGDVSDVTRSQYISLDATKLIATSIDTGDFMTVIASTAKRFGTRYFEVTIDPQTTFPAAGVGIGATWTANFANPGNSASRIWRSANGLVRTNSVDVGTEPSYELATPFTIGCKVTAADEVTFYLNGVAGTTRTIFGASSWFPFATLRRADIATLKVIAADISAMPSGATGWDD